MSEYLPGESFTHVVVKRLTAVEADPARSNQHEFNGVSVLRAMFGAAEQKRIPADFIWSPDDEDISVERGFVSWYDARARHPTRSEFRLYYAGNAVTSRARAGDLLMIGKRTSGRVAILITSGLGQSSQRLMWMAGIETLPTSGFVRVDIEGCSTRLDHYLGLVQASGGEKWETEPTMSAAPHHTESVRSESASRQRDLSRSASDTAPSWDDVAVILPALANKFA